jgi:hypothetical protein
LISQGSEIVDPNKLRYNSIAYPKETCTVEVLEIYGSIFANLDYLKDIEFKEDYNRLTASVFLSNYLNNIGIYRTQLCTLTANKYVMNRIGCFKEVSIPNEKDYIDSLFIHNYKW